MDEIFFVDLPTVDRTKRDLPHSLWSNDAEIRPTSTSTNWPASAKDSTAPKLKKPSSPRLFDAFSGQSELNTAIVKGAIADTVPLSKTMSEELNRLRTWAAGRSRPGLRCAHARDRRKSAKDRTLMDCVRNTPNCSRNQNEVNHEHCNGHYTDSDCQLARHHGRGHGRRRHDGICGRARGHCRGTCPIVRDPREEIEVEDSDILESTVGTAENNRRRARRHPGHVQPRCPRSV